MAKGQFFLDLIRGLTCTLEVLCYCYFNLQLILVYLLGFSFFLVCCVAADRAVRQHASCMLVGSIFIVASVVVVHVTLYFWLYGCKKSVGLVAEEDGKVLLVFAVCAQLV